MEIKGFYTKREAQEYQTQNGGRILWAQWSPTYKTFTKLGKEYQSALKAAGNPVLALNPAYKYIVVK